MTDTDSKIRSFKLEEEYDSSDDVIYSQALYDLDADDIHKFYLVYNMYHCPEDATIERDLVSAHNLLDYINYGIKLGQQGYTEAKIVETVRVRYEW